MELDLRTIILSNLLTGTACVLVMIGLWVQARRRFFGTGNWVIGFLLQITAFLLIALRNQIPDLISMVVSNSLVIAGAILVYKGLCHFFGKKQSQIHNWFVLGIFAVIHSFFTIVKPDLAARNLNLSVAILIIVAQSTWLLMFRIDRTNRRLARNVGAVFIAYGMISVVRIANFVLYSHDNVDYFSAGLFEALIALAYQMILILQTVTTVLMVNNRLLAEVQAQEIKFSTAFQSSPYAIVLSRLKDGLITNVNAGFTQVTGFSQDEAVGRTTTELHLWIDDTERFEAIEELLKAGNIRGRECFFRRKSGEVFPALFSTEILYINDEQFILSSINDVTERRQFEMDRHRFYDAIRRQQKQEAIGTLARGAAHEINNPLNVIINYAQLVLDDQETSVRTRSYADNILKESDRISKIVNNLIGFARQDSNVKMPVQVSDIIEQTLVGYQRALRNNGITVIREVSEELPALKCWSQGIEQALTNLVINAADALNERFPGTSESKTIKIIASAREDAGKQWIRLTVEDNGNGIPPEVAEKVFDPFFSTKSRHEGKGLGLLTSQSIINEHQGKIWFETEVGKGTRFHIDLPLNGKQTEVTGA